MKVHAVVLPEDADFGIVAEMRWCLVVLNDRKPQDPVIGYL